MKTPISMGLATGLAISLATAANTAAYASLVIDPTFDPSIASVSGAETAIDAAITTLEDDISSPNNITVDIYFTNTSSGLGGSLTTTYSLSYYNYYNALKAVATQPNQLTAVASLGTAPTSTTGNPVNGGGMVITSAEARNLGFSGAPGTVLGIYDSEISLNTSITSPPNTPLNSTNYSLESVAAHELDEALGIGGPGSQLGTGNTGVGDTDLYRYSAQGVRSYSTSTAASSYFSIDGGTTVLSYFNQSGGGADYGDWLSSSTTGNPPPGFPVQVQDAYATPGTNPTLGPNEITALNAIGYDTTTVTPLPAALPLFASGLGALGLLGWRRKRKARVSLLGAA